MSNAPDRPRARLRPWPMLAAALTVGLGLAHGWGIWLGMGGADGVFNPWPLVHDDHPLYFHSALITRHFLRQSGTTAGYDPSFMAGYAKSVVFPASSTLPELVVALSGSRDVAQAARAYKLYVLAAAALVPWLIAAAAMAWRVGPGATLLAVLLALDYLWADFPINYARFGMLPYLLAIPLGLAATAAFGRFLARGGPARWLVAALGATAVVLVHFTAAMVVAPAAALAYAMAVAASCRGGPAFPKSRHAGVWLIPAVVLAANAFWWWPGLWLAGTKGPSDFAFVHREPVGYRLARIITTEPRVEPILILLGLPGLAILWRRDRVAGAALGGFLASGFGWGYLAGAWRSLDFLQPGRHTYAFYTGAALAAGIGLASAASWLGRRSRALAALATLAALVGGVWWLGGQLQRSIYSRIQVDIGVLFRFAGATDLERLLRLARMPEPEPFLSCRPPTRLRWIIERVRRQVRPGERLLYEEGGFALRGFPDPYRAGRYSGLIPHFAPGVELLGGPYLHAALTTNFTQFGEGRLFGVVGWGRDYFVRYARLYRPAAILCWTPHARRFCRDNPDLVEVVDDDGLFLFGRVRGFEGTTIRGRAAVTAEPGRLHVEAGAAPGVDGLVVLRYHSVPCLRSRPPVPLVPVRLEDDPVPFIGLRPPPGPVTLELDPPP
jgi:hypothetical protein